jgi:hypothetical protein
MPMGAPGAAAVGPAQNFQAGGYVPPRLTPPARAQAPPARPRLVRGVRGGEPARPASGRVVLPTPDELGLGRAAPPRQPPGQVALPPPDELGVGRACRR